MNKLSAISIALILSFSAGNALYAQGFLNKLKNKMEDEALDEIFNEDKDQPSESGDAPAGESSSSGARNTKGAGLTTTAPDVNENISAASAAYQSQKYSESRHAIRQAILGVEMEMGRNVLKSLPESVSGLSKIEENDRVTSSGIGFAGLLIERTYAQNDQELRLTIGNNSVWLSAVNMYLSSGYASSDSEQNYKEVKFQDYRGVLEFDEYSGYKLSVPFGQASIFVLEGVNFENEQEVMAAAASFSINDIKEKLGEQ